MSRLQKIDENVTLLGEWKLPLAATIGSSVRARGLLLEVRAHLPAPAKKLIDIDAGVLSLRLPQGAELDIPKTLAIVSNTLKGVEDLPVIPREIEDILSISSAERHRWLKDGRLQSAGTRTVKLRGRARKITFHVFDPRHVEDVLDRDLVSVWREDDAIDAAENRRRAAVKAAQTRALKRRREAAAEHDDSGGEQSPQQLRGWEDFETDGLLR